MDQFAGLRIPDQGPPGHFDDDVGAVFAAAALAGAIVAVGRHILALHAEIQQGGQVVIHLKDHIAALAAVAAVRAAGRHVFFPVEGHGAVAALAGFDKDFSNIYKHNFLLRLPGQGLWVCIGLALVCAPPLDFARQNGRGGRALYKKTSQAGPGMLEPVLIARPG